MDNHQVVATLNNLLETTKDGEAGFRACAEGVTNPRLKAVFETAAQKCDEGAAELQAEIRRLGGEPAASGTVGGSLHRAWTNIEMLAQRRLANLKLSSYLGLGDAKAEALSTRARWASVGTYSAGILRFQSLNQGTRARYTIMTPKPICFASSRESPSPSSQSAGNRNKRTRTTHLNYLLIGIAHSSYFGAFRRLVKLFRIFPHRHIRTWQSRRRQTRLPRSPT
jgi:Domain of unknown function (DUF2383)